MALRFFLPTIIIYPPANTVVAYGVYLNNWITEEDLDKYVYAVVKGQFKDHYKDNGVVKIYYPLYKRSSGANELDIGWSVMEGKIIYGRLLWIFPYIDTRGLRNYKNSPSPVGDAMTIPRSEVNFFRLHIYLGESGQVVRQEKQNYFSFKREIGEFYNLQTRQSE